MHLHQLDISHGAITPVSKIKKWMSLHIDVWYMQGNILITQGGQACLSDFGIVDMFRDSLFHHHKPESIRYMAPEHFSQDTPSTIIIGPSKESDIYSLAMTSFEVCSSVLNHPTI